MDINAFRNTQNQEAITQRGQNEMAATTTRLSGQLRVNGAGETYATVTFPTRFIEKPLFSFGGELQDGDTPAAGHMPTISIVVTRWITQERPPQSRFYTGATLGIVTGGAAYQKMNAHWHFDGVAFTNPV